MIVPGPIYSEKPPFHRPSSSRIRPPALAILVLLSKTSSVLTLYHPPVVASNKQVPLSLFFNPHHTHLHSPQVFLLHTHSHSHKQLSSFLSSCKFLFLFLATNMQRQSLGSPASKLHINGVITIATKDSSSSPPSASSSTAKASPQRKLPPPCDDEEDGKSLKKFHSKPTSFGHPPPKKFIHVIPLLTLLCILVLYLFSHSPSQSELAHFNGFNFNALSNSLDSTNSDELQRVLEIGKGDGLTIRSARNLQGLDKEITKSRLNRKIGDFRVLQ